MAEASKVGFLIKETQLPILKETRLLLDFYELNPLGSLSSGALLIAALPSYSQKIIAKLGQLKIPAVVIGKAVSGSQVKLSSSAGLKIFPRFSRDEVARIL